MGLFGLCLGTTLVAAKAVDTVTDCFPKEADPVEKEYPNIKIEPCFEKFLILYLDILRKANEEKSFLKTISDNMPSPDFKPKICYALKELNNTAPGKAILQQLNERGGSIVYSREQAYCVIFPGEWVIVLDANDEKVRKESRDGCSFPLAIIIAHEAIYAIESDNKAYSNIILLKEKGIILGKLLRIIEFPELLSNLFYHTPEPTDQHNNKNQAHKLISSDFIECIRINFKLCKLMEEFRTVGLSNNNYSTTENDIRSAFDNSFRPRYSTDYATLEKEISQALTRLKVLCIGNSFPTIIINTLKEIARSFEAHYRFHSVELVLDKDIEALFNKKTCTENERASAPHLEYIYKIGASPIDRVCDHILTELTCLASDAKYGLIVNNAAQIKLESILFNTEPGSIVFYEDEMKVAYIQENKKLPKKIRNRAAVLLSEL